MPQTVFHKIIKGELPAYKIKETADHLAFLDIYPSFKGQVLVIPKKFTPSQFTEAEVGLVKSTIEFSQQVAKQIESNIPGSRIFLVIEGLAIDYFHIKLVPSIEGEEIMPPGTKASESELAELQAQLARSNDS